MLMEAKLAGNFIRNQMLHFVFQLSNPKFNTKTDLFLAFFQSVKYCAKTTGSIANPNKSNKSE